MLWNRLLIILAAEIFAGFMLGKILIPWFRRLKTGRLELYIGDRFKKDGSEPKFGGIIIAAVSGMGIFLGISALSSGQTGGGEGKRLAAAYIYCLLLMTLGAAEDYAKDCRKAVLGFKLRHKIAAQLMLSAAFLLVLYFQGDNTTEVLLPFRLGYMEFGYLYYPLMGLMMTGAVNCVKLHDCFSGDTSSGCDGLCASTCLIFSLIIAVCCNITSNVQGQLYAYCIAGACAAVLIWGLSPAKVYIGESGSLFLGGAAASVIIISGLHFLFILAGIGFAADAVCSAIQYFVYKRNKKFIFKGNSLHAHFKAKGWSDYKVIAFFSLVTLVGGAGAAAFSVYSTKL
ncbi:hypothetical protein [Ruminococcus sp. Marseille-P6503]|uniref:hypothetical protein n=1 Tax=Ruminococcus sp. Marseille-P6503 TaxID=2364796 RepID=UPI000F533730|nr:hypothetical protein [Ruminococcus sp. Marseille-P6503]